MGTNPWWGPQGQSQPQVEGAAARLPWLLSPHAVDLGSVKGLASGSGCLHLNCNYTP